VPRKGSSLFADDYYVKKLLPDRYPGERIKDIEFNFYPDLNPKRNITGVVTFDTWNPNTDVRPEAVSGETVYFSIVGSGGLECQLSADSASSDAEGIASVDIEIAELPDRPLLDRNPVIEIAVSLRPACSAGDATIKLNVHRNEDVDAPLAATETPDDYASTLQPVLDLKTWIVRQKKRQITSNGAIAVQQLLNQVSCRKRSGGRQFLEPDGKFGAAGQSELNRFLTDFGTAAPDAANPLTSYEACQFGVSIEQDDTSNQGVRTYIETEYGSYTQGTVVDAYVLAGAERWASGSAILAADGLLDLYTAVVWEFLEAGNDRALEYSQVALTWYRHPSDSQSGLANPWPATVTQGMSYWYGGARGLEEFVADMGQNVAPEVQGATDWLHYLNNDQCRTGLHGTGDVVTIPQALHQLCSHLQHANDNDVSAAVPWRLNHPWVDRIKRQYTGIDCSGFCQRISAEAKFRAGHCSDLSGERISRTIPVITHPNGLAVGRLSTGTFAPHYRAISNLSWRRNVVFRGDVLNRAGSHIVLLETADRTSLIADQPGTADLWIHQACGVTPVNAAASVAWPQAECCRRVVHSPMAQWSTALAAWVNDTAGVEFGRIYLWT
jgi:hypothetical protein